MTEPSQSIAHPTAVPRRMVFLSHSTRDRSIADWVAAQVEAMGIHCYVAENDPQPGAVLSSKIRAAINESDALLALLTEAGNGSTYVHQEIGAATQAGKPVLALVDKQLSLETLAMLDGIEHIRFDPADLSTASADLIAGLRSIGADRGAELTPLVVTAQPALQVQFAAELNLTGGQILVGLLLVTAIVGLVYIAAQSGDGGEAGSPV